MKIQNSGNIQKANSDVLPKTNNSPQKEEIKKIKTNENIIENKNNNNDKQVNLLKDKKIQVKELKDFINKQSSDSFHNSTEKKVNESEKKTYEDLKNYLKNAKEEINENKNKNEIHNNTKKKEEFYNVNRYMNMLSSFVNGEEEDNNTTHNTTENEVAEIHEERENNNISEKESILGSNVDLYKINILLPKEVEEIKKKKKELEKIYGKDTIEKLKSYVLQNTDKNIFKYDVKGIIELIKNGINKKELKVPPEKINELINLIPDIFSFVIADKIKT